MCARSCFVCRRPAIDDVLAKGADECRQRVSWLRRSHGGAALGGLLLAAGELLILVELWIGQTTAAESLRVVSFD